MSRPDEERLAPARVLSHLGVMGLVAVVMGVVAAGLVIPFAGALGLGASQVADSMEQLPAELETEDLAQKTFIVDSEGTTIATLYDENRINVPLSEISRTMVKAIVAIEDFRFYQHGALDMRGTLRALVTNQASGSQVQGGSSITQQLVKLTLLAQAKSKAERLAATDDTYERKIRELRYAIALEQKHSKDWILERYLNTAYFGDGAYGVQAAAQHYFDVNAKRLNLRQSAMLAGLVKNPTGYDPTNYEDKALERRNVVLSRMAELNVIDDATAEKTRKKALGLDVQAAPNGCVNSTAPFFCDYVVAYLRQDKSLGRTPKEREKALYSGGLTIRTTLDLRFQEAADRSVAAHVYPQDNAVGGLAMVEPGTGEVRALAQSRPMGRDRKAGETYLNYAIPAELGNANGFQPGSTFKAFVLAAALERDIPLSTQISAPSPVSIDMNQYDDCGGKHYASSDTWDPENSTGSGTFDLYSGTRESVNTFYAQLELATGICAPYRLAQKMGMDLDDPARERVPSFTLGVADASPLAMAEAYATFAARGLHCPSRPVTSIEDADGKLVKEYQPKCKQVMETVSADAVNAVLRGVQEPGGFGAAQGLNLTVPSAAKTGTNSSNMAVWYVGYTPKLATASMIAGANDDGTWRTLNGQTVGGSYISSAFGSTVAGPMWGDAMHAIQRWLGYENFVAPDLSKLDTTYATVPSVTGMSLITAKATLRAAGFSVAVGPATSGGGGVGTVARTFPAGGSQAVTGAAILVSPSSGVSRPPKGGGRGGDDGGDNNGGGRGGGRR